MTMKTKSAVRPAKLFFSSVEPYRTLPAEEKNCKIKIMIIKENDWGIIALDGYAFS